MADPESAPLKGINEAGHVRRQVSRTLKISFCNLKVTLCLLVIFTAGWILFCAVRFGNPSRYWPTAPSQYLQKIQDDKDEIRDDDVYNSELFKAFVKTKNFSSVSEYFMAVDHYLLSFHSPMIKEDVSLPETDAEKKQRISMSKTKYIVWLNPLPHVKEYEFQQHQFDHCPMKNCFMSLHYPRDHGKADAVVISAETAGELPPRAHADQIYILYTMEPPWLMGDLYRSRSWNSVFNWTWNYRRISDIPEVYGYLKRSPHVPSLSQLLAMKRKKTKHVAWMASHCGVPSNRDQYIQKLQKTIPVDMYGRCGNLTCKRFTPKCDLILNDYLFYLAFENCMCVDYVTEKFYKSFLEGIYALPVVRGGAKYSRFYPEGTFIDAEAFAGPEELGRYLLELAQDEARYVEMLWRKSHFVFHGLGQVDAKCELCYKMHYAHHFKQTYTDLYGWYNRDTCFNPRPV